MQALPLCSLAALLSVFSIGSASWPQHPDGSCNSRPGGAAGCTGDVAAGTATADGLPAFVRAFWQQDSAGERHHVVRVFDVGGTGVKTALISAGALTRFISSRGASEPVWLREPVHLGLAPGEAGFAEWLGDALPELQGELDAPNVTFGVSTAGRLDHATGVIRSWYGGGHPQRWAAGPAPTVAEIMGLPLGLAAFSLGTGVGLGLSSDTGSVFDRLEADDGRHHLLHGVPLSGAPCQGRWQAWLPSEPCPGVDAVLREEFAGLRSPWKMPWVSLVLGSRGLRLAQAAARCPAPTAALLAGGAGEAPAEAAVRVYARQWLHFLRSELLPEFTADTRGAARVRQLCFAGGIIEHNWPVLKEELLEDGSNTLRQLSGEAPGPELEVLPPPPAGSGLLGAGVYALAGVGGGALGLWNS